MRVCVCSVCVFYCFVLFYFFLVWLREAPSFQTLDEGRLSGRAKMMQRAFSGGLSQLSKTHHCVVFFFCVYLMLTDANTPKKCRALFGLDRQTLWCKPCRYMTIPRPWGQSEPSVLLLLSGSIYFALIQVYFPPLASMTNKFSFFGFSLLISYCFLPTHFSSPFL